MSILVEPFQALALVASAGAVGALLRYAVQRCLVAWERSLPWPVLVVNGSGAFAMGLAVGLGVGENPGLSPGGWHFIGIGLLGSFTTVSAVSHRCVLLLVARRAVLATTYLVLTVVLGIVLAWVGLGLGTAIHGSA